MVNIQESNEQRIFTLYGDTVQLPDPVINKLDYGDRAYFAETGAGYVYRGEIGGWIEDFPIP